MLTHRNSVVTWVWLFAFSGHAFADGPLPRTELAKRGKAGTALVFMDRNPRTFGTAFVVHPDGYLVTSVDAIVDAIHEGARSRLRVVLNSGNQNELNLPARVVRADKGLDIAILKIDGQRNLPTLSLGDSDRVSELTELIGFGYQLNSRVLPMGTEFPSVTVAAITISSVRRKTDGVSEIQFERGFSGVGPEFGPNAGASLLGQAGGPLLSADGKVAGVFHSNIHKTNCVLPVNVLRKFLAAPDITLSEPTLELSKLNQPAEFVANVVAPLPGGPTFSVEMSLDLKDGPPRKFPMALKNGAYQAVAVPVPSAASGTVGIAAKFAETVLSGTVPDREFTIGGKPRKLSEVRRLEFGENPKAIAWNGETVTGPVVGLDGVELRLADQTVPVNLTKSREVDFVPSVTPNTMLYTVVVSVDRKEVASKSVAISLPKASDTPIASAKSLDLESLRVPIGLPDQFTDVCVGGGGRYLLFLFPKLSQIGLFDVSQGKIIHRFPVPDSTVKFAAGADKLVIGLPTQGILQRWSLTTFEREVAIPYDQEKPIRAVWLGHASRGPVVVNGQYLELDSFKPMRLEVSKPKNPEIPNPRSGNARRVSEALRFQQMDLTIPRMGSMSADGTVLCQAFERGPAWGLRAIIRTDSTLTTHIANYESSYAIASPDGKLIFTPSVIFSSDLKVLLNHRGEIGSGPMRYLPAVQGEAVIAVRQTGFGMTSGVEKQGIELTLHWGAGARPLARIGRLEGNFLGFLGGEAIPFYKRLFLIPDAKLLVMLPPNENAVHLFRLDIDEILKMSDTDYLFLAANPPNEAKKASWYRHQLAVKSKRGSVRCKLDNGPQGMTVATNGLIEWSVPANFKDKEIPVIVSITDASGQEVIHSFTMKILD
jgi:hypothetical protein